MNLSIVIVTWQSAGVLGACLRSLESSDAAEILVVDNDSHDGTYELVRQHASHVDRLSLSTNVGFAAACNRGLAATSGEAVLFLNPDVRAAPGSVQALLATLQRCPGAAAVGGLLVSREGQPQDRYLPRSFPTFSSLARQVLLPALKGSRHMTRSRQLPVPAGAPAPLAAPAQTTEVDQVAGACLLARRSALLSVGGFDAGFWPVWFEDVDLCLRLSRAGHLILHQADAPFVHAGAASVQQMDAVGYYAAWYRNLHRYAAKHLGPTAAGLLRGFTVSGMALRTLATLLPVKNGPFHRGSRAAAYMHVASRSLFGWRNASRSRS